ncbi:MAG TPA: hypothetical protein VEB67_03670, partial [Nitrososphaerales archaeon]|nr:hypothetical protein [Nitrososphaerales archaeon]
MKKWVMSRRDSAGMVEEVEKAVRRTLDLSKSAQAECAEPAPGVVFVDLGGMTFVQAEGRCFPYLGSPGALALVPSATVD